ncbi:MAG: hypothetical protein J6X94_04700 [Lachnospiraceae bacterium]|nr:hypothetical protein [Lachnospiraceae bacterium]
MEKIIKTLMRKRYGDINGIIIMVSKTGWGRLKSGVGWIVLSYTERV